MTLGQTLKITFIFYNTEAALMGACVALVLDTEHISIRGWSHWYLHTTGVEQVTG